MPQAIPIIAAAAFSATSITAGVITFSAATFAINAAIGVALGFVSQALAPKPKQPSASNFERQATDRTVMVRQAITTGKIDLGRIKVSGAQTFVEKTGGDNGTMHVLLTLGATKYASLDELWFNDENVPLGAYSSGSGYALSGKYGSNAKVWFGDGTTSGDADLHAALTAAVGSDKWGPTDKQTGWSKLYVQLTFNADVFPSGTPNISAVCRTTSDIRDSRTDTEGWTDNAALCLAYYLTREKKWGGFGASWDEIDEDELIAAANACDEMVGRKSASVTFTAATSDILTVADKTAALRTGTRLTVASDGTLPGGSTAATNYFWIATGELSGKLASSLVNARAGTAVDITDAGSGTHTLTVNAEPRYTCNGTIETADTPESICGSVLSAMAGRLLRNQGKWKTRAGVWQGADGSLDQSDIIESFQVKWFREPRDVYNGVKGTFKDPDSDWQPTDFPVVQIAQYVADDQGEENWKDADLPYTVSPSMAQRIVRIDLERIRRQITTGLTTKLTALNIAAGDIVSLDWPRYGWAGKYFEVASYKPVLRKDAAGAPLLAISLGFSEIDENVYAWTPDQDENAFPPSPRTNLPSADIVAAPGAPIVSEELYETTGSRGVAVRAVLSWAAAQDAFIDVYQPEYRLVGAETWIILPRTSIVTAEINDIDPGIYDFRVKAINLRGASSEYATTRREIVGLSDAPDTPVNATLQKFGGQALINLQPHPALDVRIGGRYLVKHSEALSDPEWSESFSIGKQEGYPGDAAFIALPLKPGSYLVRAVDSSGIQSPGWISLSTDGADIREFADVDLIQEDDEFSGDKDGTVATDGILKLSGVGDFDSISDFDSLSSLDDFGGAVSSGTYNFAAGLDLGTKRRVRLLSIIAGIISNANDFVDDRTDNIDSWLDFDGDDGGSAADCWIEVRTTDDDPSGSPVWSAWNRVDSTEVYCRAVQARAQLRSTDPAYNILISILRLKIEELA